MDSESKNVEMSKSGETGEYEGLMCVVWHVPSLNKLSCASKMLKRLTHDYTHRPLCIHFKPLGINKHPLNPFDFINANPS